MRSEADAPSTQWIGADLAGYRIESLIDQGGMGDVYLAQNPLTGNKVAVKILAPEFAYLDDVRERLIRESRLVSRIDHPNILRIYDADFSGGALYVAMRYVEGPNLKRVLHQQRRFSFDGILVIMSQLASALDAAHTAGLFHGNVKPGNVLIAPKKGADGSDFVYLAGFGITRRLERPARLSGELAGAVDYVAPERFEDGPIDARSDIYSLGCLLLECLVSRDIPPAVRDVIGKAIATDPDRRYATCAEMITHLGESILEAAMAPRSERLLPATEPAATVEHEVERDPEPEPETEPEPTAAVVAAVEPEDELESEEEDEPGSESVASLLREIAVAAATEEAVDEHPVSEVSDATPAVIVAPVAPEETRKPAPSKPRKDPNAGRKKGVVAAIAVGILLLGGTAVFASTRGHTKSASAHASHASSSPSSPASGGAVARPSNVRGTSTRSSVTLFWGKPSTGNPESYVIERAGKSWTTSNTKFTESKLAPASRFTYALYAVAQDGTKSPAVTRSVRTATPSQWAGLLSGSYAAHVAANQPYNDTWRFKPSCKTGPCGAVWTAAAFPGIRAGLSFKGKTYQGTSNDAVFAVTCNGNHIPSIVTMHITQAHSKLAGGKWKIVSFSGWIYVVVPASTNCSSGQFSNTFTAHA